MEEKDSYMLKKQFISLLLVFTFCHVAAALNPVDSLLQQFDRQPSAQTANRFLEVLHKGGLTDEPIELSDRMPADTLRQQIWYWASEYCYAIQDYQRAIAYGKQALPLIPPGSDMEADCLNLLSISYIRISNYEQAAAYAQRCHELDKRSGDADRISSSLNTLAAIYLGANQPSEAEKYVMEGIETAKKADNPGRMAVLQAMASEVYHAKGDDQQALGYINEAIRLDSLHGMEERARMRLAQRASVLIGLHRYQEAESTLRDVIPFLRQTGDQQSLGIALNKMGMALLSQHRESEAIPYYQEAADLFVELGDPYNEIHARRGLYESKWESQPDEARQEMRRFNDLKDSIYSITSAESLARYNAEFGNDWLQLKNHRQQRTLTWIVVIAALLATIAGICIYRNRRHNIILNDKLKKVLTELEAERQQNTTEETAESKKDFLSRVTEVIYQQIDKGQADVSHVAATLSISPSKLRQQLAEVTDEQPKDLIRRLRIERAQHLLKTRTDLTIQETAYLCGYTDAGNFTRAFKHATGITPTEYQGQGVV